MVALATRRGLAVAAQLSRRRVPAGGAGLVQRAPALSRAEVGALLRRWSSSSPKKGPAGGGGSAMKGASSQPPKLDGWLGMTALEVADATADPWTAFRMRLAVLVQFGCFLYILNNYGLSSTLCQGPSMMPTLNPAGDVVLVEHVTTTLGRLERGHVIVAKSPTDPNAVVCKRILGLPGDTVRLPSLTHNASSAGLFSCEHDHPNTHPPSDHPPSAIRVPTPNRIAYHSRIALCGAGVLCSALHIPQVPRDPRYPYFRGADEDIVVPAGKVWLQGDNVRNSTDSRNYGAVPLPLITGRVFFKVPTPHALLCLLLLLLLPSTSLEEASRPNARGPLSTWPAELKIKRARATGNCLLHRCGRCRRRV
jgi:signal peptidase I